MIDYAKISSGIEDVLEELFLDDKAGVSGREDSRSFGAMIEKKITSNWESICEKLGYEYVDIPGRRTIYDFACKIDGVLFGFDLKTKDLDEGRYSDGGICAVGNLLKFLANDKGIFMVVEACHLSAFGRANTRILEKIKIVPFHILPEDAYRIENLGTGQVRLNYTITEVLDKLQWDRSYNKFFDIFTLLCIEHYEKVGKVATKRKETIEKFRKDGYERLNNFR